MKRLNCFATGFSLAPSRVIYQHGGETPSQAPTPPEGGKKEKPTPTPQEMEARKQREAQERVTRKFQERVDKVKELQTKLGELQAKQEKAMKSGQEKQMDTTEYDTTEYDLIHEQMVDLAKQFNQELGLNIDFQNLQFLNIEVKGKGMYITINTEGPDKKSHHVHVGLRPDGTYERREMIYPDRSDTYYDSRTGERATYHIDNDQERFQKERAGRFWPSTE